jgi:DNA polymerase
MKINTIHIDFESYSEINLKMFGAMRYAQDTSTELICLAYSINRKKPRLWILGDKPPKRLFKAILNGYQVHAWNAFFEMVMWEHICVAQMGWPKIRFDRWRDSQAVAASFALPVDLDNCGSVLDLDIQKDKRGKYLIQKLCKPRGRTSKANPDPRWLPHTAPEDFEDMYQYCIRDVEAEIAIEDALPKPNLSPRELEVWRLTVRKNLRGLPLDYDLICSVISKMNEYQHVLEGRISELTNGVITTGGQTQRMRTWLDEEHGVDMSSMDKAHIEDALLKDIPGPARKLLMLRQSLSKSSTKKFVKLKGAAIEGRNKIWRIYGCLRYHKATTGRWGGALFQPHNLPRAAVSNPEQAVKAFKRLTLESFMVLYPDVSYTASAMVRPSICAPKGMILFDSDYSSVENCTVMWLADDRNGLKLLRNGMDLYIDMAISLHPKYTYAWIKEHKGISSTADHLRRHGKLTILGAVYSMGWKKFKQTCELMGFPINNEDAQFTINTFRQKYRSIVELWYGLERAAKDALKTPGVVTKYLRIRFLVENGFLYMILPNNKRLAYYNPGIEVRKTPWGQMKPVITHEGYLGTTRKWGRPVLTPGRLTENASQATARELLVDGMFNLEDDGYRIILSIHDEALALVKKGAGSMDEFNTSLCKVSSVFKTIPLKASGFMGKRFRK